jgi:hypothetical protein
MSIIRLSCSPEVRRIIKGMRNPLEMWNTLETSLDTTRSYMGRQDILPQFCACRPKEDEPLNAYFTKLSNYRIQLVLATGPGNPPAVRVRTGKTVRFGSRTVQKPDPQRLGGPNPDPYLSTRGFCRVWLDPSVPISGSVFRVFLFMVAFRYPTVNRKILTFAHH